MYNSFYFIVRFFKEIFPSIQGGGVLSVHSQNKDIIHLTFGEGYHLDENLVIEFSTVANSPYLLKRKYFKPAGKNLVYFFKDVLPQRVIDIKVAYSERMFMFILEKGYLFLVIKGSKTNLFYTDTGFNSLNSAKKSESLLVEAFFQENVNLNFITLEEAESPPYFEDMNSYETLKSAYPFLGKELIRELKCCNDKPDYSILKKKIEAIFSDDIKLVRDNLSGKLQLFPSSFSSDDIIIKVFKDVTTALQEFIASSKKQDAEFQIRKRVETKIKKDYAFFVQKEENLIKLLATENRAIFYEQCANLILINMNAIDKGAEFTEVENIFADGSIIKISLKAKLTANGNADVYFKKGRVEKLKFETGVKSLSMVRQKIVDLKSKLILFEKMDLNDLRNYEKNMIQTENEQRGSYRDEVKVRRFFIDEKWEVLVGKDSENNDILTVKVAKQNDYWFHARGSSGSHVVLRFNGKEKPPKDIIKKTAQIAAFYSKAKNSKIVPVCYTQKKYVVKRKGMDPGQVSLLREDVVMVAPVLPEGCISDSAE